MTGSGHHKAFFFKSGKQYQSLLLLGNYERHILIIMCLTSIIWMEHAMRGQAGFLPS